MAVPTGQLLSRNADDRVTPAVGIERYDEGASMDRTRAHVFIAGRVQGVNFRASTQNEARQAGVAGWVRNLSDGRVEAVFEGSESAVQQLISWCHRGPSLAHVENVEVNWEEPEGLASGFGVR